MIVCNQYELRTFGVVPSYYNYKYEFAYHHYPLLTIVLMR